MASEFTYQIYEAVPSGQLHLDTSASAMQIRNFGPATALIIDAQWGASTGFTDGQVDTSRPDGSVTGWPLAPGESIRLPGGTALVNVMQTPDALRARLAVIKES